MSDYKYEELLRNSIVGNKIKASHLVHIPKMKDCDHWEDATFIGRVKYKFKYSEYDGGLIKYHGRIYYINTKQITPLAQCYKWKNVSNILGVIDDMPKES